MAEIKDILSLMRGLAPESATEPGFDDNVGLLLGSEKGDSSVVMLCLDCTENVVREAAAAGTRLVISHHPAIFRSVRRITDGDPTGRMLLAAASAGISVYSAHTNLDFCEGGLNDYNAELMGLSDVRPMLVEENIKVGRIGKREPVTVAALAEELARTFTDGHIRYVGTGAERVSKIAVINGGGGDIDFISRAMELGADCYITADVPHHAALFAAQNGFPLIIMQHYTMERVYMNRLAELLARGSAERGLDVIFRVAESEHDPAHQEGT